MYTNVIISEHRISLHVDYNLDILMPGYMNICDDNLFTMIFD